MTPRRFGRKQVLEQLVEELLNLLLRHHQRAATACRGSVNAPVSPAALARRTEQALVLHRMQQWIKGARADFVAIATKVLDHLQPEDWPSYGLIENVHVN